MAAKPAGQQKWHSRRAPAAARRCGHISTRVQTVPRRRIFRQMEKCPFRTPPITTVRCAAAFSAGRERPGSRRVAAKSGAPPAAAKSAWRLANRRHPAPRGRANIPRHEAIMQAAHALYEFEPPQTHRGRGKNDTVGIWLPYNRPAAKRVEHNEDGESGSAVSACQSTLRSSHLLTLHVCR